MVARISVRSTVGVSRSRSPSSSCSAVSVGKTASRLLAGLESDHPRAGEAAEFDTRMPHWFGSAGAHPVEILSILGRQGERIHVRARPRTARAGD
jgi:hypothetical protein